MSSNVLQHQKIGFVQDLQPVSVETLNTNLFFVLIIQRAQVMRRQWFFLIFKCQRLKHTSVLADLMNNVI